ncbi:MAG: hypothetical protein AAB434_02380 [Planctomycetota bacterium]
MAENPENLHDASNRLRRQPFDLQVPFWATPSFRWLIIFAVMFLGLVVVLVFDIVPKMQGKLKRTTPPPTPLDPRVHAIRFDGVLNTVKDGTPIDMGERAYQYLVRHLESTDPESLAKAAREVSYVHFGNQPNDLRGETLQVQALLVDKYALRLDPSVGGREWVYRVILANPFGNEGYTIDLLDAPPEIERKALVQVEGIFVKNATYETKDEVKTVPFFLGRRMTLVTHRTATSGADMEPWIVGIGSAAAVLFVLFSIRVYRQARRKSASSLPVTKLS